ncbi:MAG: ClbS/DfsB family four-helix bundle protein [Anaerolineales bacterium]|jgi:hypothetical protein
MTSKPEILTMLRSEFDHWEELLNGLSEEQIAAPNFISGWSIKDTFTHLMAWQTRSIARLEAAQSSKEPDFPRWPVQPLSDPGDNTEKNNAWIYQTYCEEPWSVVYSSWRNGFLHFLELAQAIPEKVLQDLKRYPWMEGQSLLVVLQSSYEHHHIDRLEPLLTLLHQQSK